MSSGISACLMLLSASLFIAMKTSSMTSPSSSTSILFKLHAPSDDDFSPFELGKMCRGSVQLCKTNITWMWPLSWQGMVYTFIKADNTTAALYIFNTVTVKTLQGITTNVTEKSPSWEANSCSDTHLIPHLLQTMMVHYYFYHSLTHSLSPNSFSPNIFCSHTHSSLNNITITAHMFSVLQMPCWHTKMGDQKSVLWQIMEP